MHSRPSLLALGLTVHAAVLGACTGDDAERRLDATITAASLSVDDATPDVLAGFDATVSLEVSGDFDEIRLLAVRAVTLPEGEDSLRAEITAVLQGPQDNAPVIAATSGSTVVGRIVNIGTTHAQLLGWCRLIVEVSVEFEGDELRSEASTELAVTCP